MTVCLIRHGATQANEEHLYCGVTDLPLSPAGRQQLAKIHYPQWQGRFITSGWKRCDETLRALFGAVSYTVEPELREMDFGSFEMRGYEELKEDPAYQAWICGNNEANRTPGGESGNQMAARSLAAFSRIVRQEQDTCIITHGGVIAAIMEHLFPEENKNRYQWQPRNGEGYRLLFCGGQVTYAPIGGYSADRGEDPSRGSSPR